MSKENAKIFLIINLSFFGDVLLTNTLCQNLKKHYPSSKIVFAVNKPFCEAAKYQACVDDVIVVDKRGSEKGLWGLYKFANQCEYKNKIDAAFIIYGNDRGILLSYFLNCKKRISGPMKFTKFFLTDIHIETDGFVNMQDINGNFAKALTGEKAEVVPIEYKPFMDGSDFFVKRIQKEFKDADIVALCATSKNKVKDLPVKTAVEIIDILNKQGKTVFYVGAGAAAKNFANDIKKHGCMNFVDFTDVTSINQLAHILKMSRVLISVDTGTMHLACALKVPVVSVFYRPETIPKWAPRDFLYKCAVIDRDYSARNICEAAESLLTEQEDFKLKKIPSKE